MMMVTVDLDHTLAARVGNRPMTGLSVWHDDGIIVVEAGTDTPIRLQMSARELIVLGHACLAVGRNAVEQAMLDAQESESA